MLDQRGAGPGTGPVLTLIAVLPAESHCLWAACSSVSCSVPTDIVCVWKQIYFLNKAVAVEK